MTGRKAELNEKLAAARERTLWLMTQVPDDLMRVRVHSFYSPIGWHFGHIARTEEWWCCAEASGLPPLDHYLSFLLADTPENPKDNRVNIPDRDGLLAYMAATRENTLEALEGCNLGSPNPLIHDCYAWEFAYKHECQHQETIAEMMTLIHQSRGDEAPWVENGAIEWMAGSEPDWVSMQGGAFAMGTNDPNAYDNEGPAHEVNVSDFCLMRWPVSCFQWTEFMADDGYGNRKLWTEEGWQWRCESGSSKPQYWLDSTPWSTYSPIGKRILLPDEPVFGICLYEADAYCRWTKSRLPSEAEWEVAAHRSSSALGAGQASSGLSSWRPNVPSELNESDNEHHVDGLLGGVWEWTASRFLPYPGFRAFPYDGYSKDHMYGGHFVCRGGSWASQQPMLRPTFRNWYVPSYRQGFLGLRCAR